MNWKKMDDLGFKTLTKSVRELASRYDVSLNKNLNVMYFKKLAQML